MTHPLHDYIATKLAEKLKSRKIVVWYDPRTDFTPFIAELRGGPRTSREPIPVSVDGLPALLAEYAGSMFELRALVEPHTRSDDASNAVLYLPGCEHDKRNSVLMELEKAGTSWHPTLNQFARNVLLKTYTLGVVDEVVPLDRQASYEDLARASSATSSGEAPSLLKGIFQEAKDSEGLVAAWLARPDRDDDLVAKGATGELAKLVRSQLGLEWPSDALPISISKARAFTVRYVLVGEFRSDLASDPPATVAAIPEAGTKERVGALRSLAGRLRSDYADAYEALADGVENELRLRDAKIPAEALGSIDTFRFEERALLTHCSELIAKRAFDEALRLVTEREKSFWLDRDVAREGHWEACRRMATLGQLAVSITSAVSRAGTDPEAWIEAYVRREGREGWYRLDQAQRHLEAWVTNLDEPDERSLGIARRVYEDACHAMAQGFTAVLERARWALPRSMHQTRVYGEVVAGRPKPVAYFLVDAMRFEMGVELAERLPKHAEVALRHAVCALPSITRIGMAALQPGASASFSVVERGGELGALIDETFLPGLPARKRLVAARVPNLVDLTLDEVLSLQGSRLAKKLEGAQVILVRSQEIDHAGETGFTFQARTVMDTVIDNLARAIRKLAAAGVEHAVVSADHGHLFFGTHRDESMRTDAPGGAKVELHRRCWIGRGGSTPAGCVRVSATQLGYASDLDFIFPAGSGVFKAGGDLAFHHGGPSLQELIVPVLTVRSPRRASQTTRTEQPVRVAATPKEITNRIVRFEVGSLLGAAIAPLLLSKGKKVGGLVGSQGGVEDLVAGTVVVHPGGTVSLMMRLFDDTVPEVNLVLQDPTTDAELYRSPAIPVRLM